VADTGKYFRYNFFNVDAENTIFSLLLYISFLEGRKIMSSISGINSSSLLNILSNSLNASASSNAEQNTMSDSTDTQATSDAADASISSLVDQLKISFLQNQYSFLAALSDPDDSTSSDSLTSLLENAETDKTNNVMTSNLQLAQLLAMLNSSSASSESDDPAISILQSPDSSDLSQNNSDALRTALESLLKFSGNDVNSSTRGMLDQYLSRAANNSSQIKTTV
jgi:hypothetical protein